MSVLKLPLVITKEQRIEELLTLIGGCEIAMRSAKKNEDFKMRITVEKIQKQKLKELKAVIYGLEERTDS